MKIISSIVFFFIILPLLLPSDGVPPQEVFLTGPSQGFTNHEYWFSALVFPDNVDRPITYTWNITDHPPMEMVDGDFILVILSWNTGGVKEITVTAENAYGSVTKSLTVEIQESAGGTRVYLPMTVKQ